jgi:F-type H+-transporting ATPase subunit gamma
VIFASEHGFVGALNRGLVEAAAESLAAGADLFVVGRRGLSAAAESGVPVRWSGAMTSQAAGVPSLARRLAEELHERFSRGELTAIDMVFACQSGLGRHTLARQSLLPLDRTAFPPPAEPPLIQLTPERLAERLIEEYWFAELARAAMEALTAENAARVVALTAARDNIDRRLEDLRRRDQSLRQEEITTELLDIVTGSEAVFSAVR